MSHQVHGEQVHGERRDPETPSGAFDLLGAARELLTQASQLAAGRAARTLTPGAGAPLKQTLLAISAGGQLAEHQAPGPATIQVLVGRAILRTGEAELVLDENHWAAIPPETHDLRAETETAVLLTVALPGNAPA